MSKYALILIISSFCHSFAYIPKICKLPTVKVGRIASFPDGIEKIPHLVSSLVSLAQNSLSGLGSFLPSKNRNIYLELDTSPSFRYRFVLKDKTLAERYLSLPVSKYNVLDSNFVQKSNNSEDEFMFTFPVGLLSEGYEMATRSSLSLPPFLTTLLRVKRHLEDNRLIFSSSEMYFSSKNDSDSEAIGTSSSSPSSNYSYPLWVSWFGNDIESSCFKSSIQCALSISLNWNQEHLARSTSSSWSSWWFPSSSSSSSSDSMENINQDLLVEAAVQAAIHTHIPLLSSSGSILMTSFPCNKILTEILSLLVHGIMELMTKSLVEKLTLDYEDRKQQLKV